MRRATVALVVALALSACGEEGDDELVVFAAASLAASFEEIERAFEAANPGVDVTVSVGGSSTLVTQVLNGAPVDVIATADLATMQRLVEAGRLAGAPEVAARNRLALAVAPGNPLGIASIGDLADPELVVLACAPEVPCGAFAAEVIDASGVDVVVDSLEANVGAVVSKVALGEADVGFVYVTDIAAAEGRIDGVAIVDNVDTAVPIAVVADAVLADAAEAFVDFVLGEDGQAIFDEAGFASP